MIFRLEAVPESIVHQYFLQVLALLNLRFPGSRIPVGSTVLYKVYLHVGANVAFEIVIPKKVDKLTKFGGSIKSGVLIQR